MRNIRLQYAGWDDLPPDFQAFFHFMLGADTARGRTFYELYYLWFNIPHEIAHVLREKYGTTDDTHLADEIAVTAFAVAYWRQRGETQRLSQLAEMLRGILKHLPDPLPDGYDRGAYFEDYYDKLVASATRFCHYMFSMALAAIDAPAVWLDVLRAVITPTAQEAPSPIVGPYASINTLLPRQIVADMDEFLAPHGIEMPPITLGCGFEGQLQFATWERE